MRAAIFALGLVLAAVAQQPPQPRYVDSPDLTALFRPLKLPGGVMNPAYDKLVDHPSRYYEDFYGIQALRDVTRGQVLRDFVPRYARLAASSAHAFSLRFRSGWLGTFYPHSSLNLGIVVLPYSHMIVSGVSGPERVHELNSFRAILAENHWQSRYLVPNEHYQAEVAVERQLQHGHRAAVTVDPSLTAYYRQPRAVFIYPEYVHGNAAGQTAFLHFISAHRFDWAGMEMLDVRLQPTLDAYSTSPPGSAAFRAAHAKLAAYFATHWQMGHYLKIAEALRAHGAHLYGLESVSLAWIAFNYGQTPFGGAVRSYLWAERVPLSGHGLVYGGSDHFHNPKPVSFQDFLALREPGVHFYTVVHHP